MTLSQQTRQRLIIACYSFDFDQRLFETSPVIEYFSERGLHQLTQASQSGAHVVCIVPQPLPDSHLQYYYRLYGLDPQAIARTHIVSPAPAEEYTSLARRVKQDPDLMDWLRQSVADFTDIELSVYTPTHESAELAEILGAHLSEGPTAVLSEVGNKSGGKRLLANLSIPVAPGAFETYSTWSEIVEAAANLVHIGATKSEVVVKLDSERWGSNFGNAKLRVVPLAGGHAIAGVVAGSSWSVEDLTRGLSDYGGIVEAFVDNAESVGCLGRIEQDGKVSAGAGYRQILDPAGKHVGSVFGGRDPWQSNSSILTVAVGERLRQLGYRGEYGVDFLLVEGAELIGLEINLRKTGSLHAVRQLQAISQDAYDEVSGYRDEQMWMIYKQLSGSEFVGADLKCLEDELVMCDADLRDGGLFVNVTSGLTQLGFVDVTAVGTTLSDCWERIGRVESALAESSAITCRAASDANDTNALSVAR